MSLFLIRVIGAGAVAILSALPAAAQSGGQQANQGPAAPAPRLTECSAARDPVRCEQVVKVKLSCQELRGAKRRACLEDRLPPPDCSKARNRERCEARVAATAACQGTIGVERRDCKRAQRKLLRQAASKK